MRFGSVPLDQAIGAVLAHSVAVGAGRLRKGKQLDAEDIARLVASGETHVTVARMEQGDIAEDDAAARIGAALCCAGLTASSAATGRVNLIAKRAGLVHIRADRVASLNRIDPAITLATVPDWHRVAAGDLVCTVKIIPYAVRATCVAQAEAQAVGVFDLQGPVAQTATLIETSIGGVLPSDKGRRVLMARLARFDIKLSGRVIVPHTSDALAQAMQIVQEDVIFVLTASATSDARDVGPLALTKAGGVLTRFGMPVDPGNLLYFGEMGGKPVIGLPGCARSPALNGADWVMERILCGVAVTSDDIAAMGVGGLLKEPPSRPRPRQG